MLKKIQSSSDEFKTLQFRAGLNILLAEKGAASSITDSRNGAGKSSLIEILHFALGLTSLTDSVLKHSALSEHSFSLLLDWQGPSHEVRVTRSLSKRPKVILEPNVAGATQLVQTAGEATTREWTAAIGRDLFSLPADHAGLSARTLISFYVRRVSQHGMDEAERSFPRQSASEATTNLAYLLGLDWRLAAEYQGIASREKLRRQLTRATKDPVFGLVIGTVAELRGQLVAASKRVAALKSEVATFRVVPEHELLQRQADEIDTAIRGSRMADAADRRNLADLEASLDAQSEPDSNYIDRVYRDLGIHLPDAVTHSYEQVRDFHASVVSNRRSYLAEEVQSVSSRLDERETTRDALGTELARLLNLLSEGGALDSYTALQEQLAFAQSKTETLSSRLETAKRLEATRTEIKLERASLQQRIELNLEERAAQVDEINSLFQRFSAALYGAEREAFVEITATGTSLRIQPHIGGEDSRGIGKMVIFCFDFTWAVLARRAARGPDFLVHDSHLFDGVDERQVSRALQLATQICEEEDMQYVITMNSDELEKTAPYGFESAAHILSPTLTDEYDNGGLFGFRFE